MLPALRPALQENCLFEVNAVASTDAIGILEASLQRSGRRLQGEQLSLVLNSLKKAEDVTMLHVRLLHDRTVKWHSFDTVTAPPASVTGLIHSMFEDIERRSGVRLVTKVMGLMNAARAGLSEVSSSLLCALSLVLCLLRTHHVSLHDSLYTDPHSEAQSVYFTLFHRRICWTWCHATTWYSGTRGKTELCSSGTTRPYADSRPLSSLGDHSTLNPQTLNPRRQTSHRYR